MNVKTEKLKFMIFCSFFGFAKVSVERVFVLFCWIRVVFFEVGWPSEMFMNFMLFFGEFFIIFSTFFSVFFKNFEEFSI